ncbi:AbfB domain-containing protein [Actinoplanes sp. NPDC051494]|uniref:AbfB domain-containing protein n=1 Tax=Actinoplanes sp. NPDC051494 TaxID=3363907 RepID=UPI0037BD72DE
MFAAILTMAGLVSATTDDKRPAGDDSAGSWAAPWTPGTPAVPVPIFTDEAPSREPVATLTTTAAARTSRRATVAPPSSPAPPAPTPSRTPAPSPGDRVSLVADGTAGLLLRHRDFRLRLDPVGDDLSRADATFVLRRGLADSRCLSLEAVNYPGLFVRHQNFALVLRRPDRGATFAADATFCRQDTGGTTVLRSANFPDHYLIADGGLIGLRRVPAANAQRFRFTAPAAPVANALRGGYHR